MLSFSSSFAPTCKSLINHILIVNATSTLIITFLAIAIFRSYWIISYMKLKEIHYLYVINGMKSLSIICYIFRYTLFFNANKIKGDDPSFGF